MLTIKVINERTGFEYIKEVKSVVLRPAQESASSSRCFTYYDRESDVAFDIFEGTVYVMNGEGKTVANYNFPYIVSE